MLSRPTIGSLLLAMVVGAIVAFAGIAWITAVLVAVILFLAFLVAANATVSTPSSDPGDS
jgi:uncharacterized membrane protein YoaK (UPF0700 family)